ncbi:MAG: hypothetical protein AYK22_06935 [Thermoplasmatales archaeon SG8-52-3]|nr:MAG: hypothetical protein AYK22_06935 [Thermoplasmatales archaeon SG8-52-3]
MSKQRGLLNKTLILGIVLLFVGMSIVSTIGKPSEFYPVNKNQIISITNPKDLILYDHLAFIIGEGSDCHIYDFILNDPNNLSCVCEGSGGWSNIGTTWSDAGHLYTCQYGNGLLYGIDLETCDMWSIGGGGPGMNGLAYDIITGWLYGSSDNNYLYKFDLETGEQEQIGPFGGGVQYMVGMAFDANGTLYGWDLGNDALWTIDTESGEATMVGYLGINIYYSCDGDFCKEDDILYLVINNSLFICDKNTGQIESSPQGQFPEYVTVTGLAIPYEYEDIIPPKTTHSLNPPEPDGKNGWYISDVNVTLSATDDLSGVKEIRYTINNGSEQVIPGDNGSFILNDDGDDILIEYWAVDNAGNFPAEKKFFTIDIDQTVPEVAISYEIHYDKNLGHFFTFTTVAVDEMSGMDYVEFYRDNQIMKTVYGSGPEYVWDCEYSNITHIKGIIRNREIAENYVKFRAIFILTEESTGNYSIIDSYGFDKAGNMGWDEILGNLPPGPINKILLLKNLILPNNYTGYIGRFFIYATFNTG